MSASLLYADAAVAACALHSFELKSKALQRVRRCVCDARPGPRLPHGWPPRASHERWIHQVAEDQRLQRANLLPCLLASPAGCLQHLLYRTIRPRLKERQGLQVRVFIRPWQAAREELSQLHDCLGFCHQAYYGQFGLHSSTHTVWTRTTCHLPVTYGFAGSDQVCRCVTELHRGGSQVQHFHARESSPGHVA